MHVFNQGVITKEGSDAFDMKAFALKLDGKS